MSSYPGRGPACCKCGRPMEVVAWGFSPNFGESATAAECEECGITWGRYTGYAVQQ